MSIVYLNGEFIPQDEARISPFDRGFLFADSIYEVTACLEGQLVDFDRHFDRLLRSCGAIGLSFDYDKSAILLAHEKLIKVNNIRDGGVYLQISRGGMGRDFLISGDLPPTLFMFAEAKVILDHPNAATGIRVVSCEDQRWGRCHIKTTQLLAQSLARTSAVRAGVHDAWMVRGEYVTEGCTSNAFIVSKQGVIITSGTNENILPGITRQAVLECAVSLGFEVALRPFTLREAMQSAEAFSTSASSFLWPVVEIDGTKIGEGVPGPISQALRRAYIARATGNLAA